MERFGYECLGALGDEVVRPLLDFRDGEVVGSGEFRGGGFAFDDVHDRRGLAASGPSFDVVVWITHGVPPFPMEWRKWGSESSLFAVQFFRGTLHETGGLKRKSPS